MCVPEYIRSGLVICAACLWLALPALAEEQIVQHPASELLNEGLIRTLCKDRAHFLWIIREHGIDRFDGSSLLSFGRQEPAPFTLDGGQVKSVLELQDGSLFIAYENVNSYQVLNPLTLAVHRVMPITGTDISVIDLVAVEGIVYALTRAATGTSIHALKSDYRFAEIMQVPTRPNARSIRLFPALDGFWLLMDDCALKELDMSGKVKRELRFNLDAGEDCIRGVHAQDNGTTYIYFDRLTGIYEIPPGNTNFYLVEELPRLRYHKIWEDTRGNLMLFSGSSFSSSNALILVRNDLTTIDLTDQIVPGTEVNCLLSENFEDGLLLGTIDGILTVRPRKKFLTILDETLNPGEWGKSLRGMIKSPSGALLIAREFNNFYLHDPVTLQTDTLFFPNRFSDPDRDFQCSSDLIFLDSVVYSSAHFPNDSFGLLQLDAGSGEVVQSIELPFHIQSMVRIGAQIWMAHGRAGMPGGLVAFDPELQVSQPFMDQSGKNPFSGVLPRVLAASGDSLLWMGSDRGLFRIDLHRNTVRRYRADVSVGSLSHEIVIALLALSDGTLAIGTEGGGLDILDPREGTLINFTTADGLADNRIAGFLEETDGMLWVSTFNGLSRMDISAREFYSYSLQDGLPHMEFNRLSAFKDEEGVLYFGGLNGLLYFHPADVYQAEKKPAIFTTKMEYYEKNGSRKLIQSQFEQHLPIQIPADNKYFFCQVGMSNLIDFQNNKYQYRLSGRGSYADWIDLETNKIMLNSIPAGKYGLEIRGMTGRGVKSKGSVNIELEVQELFFKTARFRLIALAVFFGIVYLISYLYFRNRIKIEQLKQALSRDLHDEVGSILGGVAMKAELLEMKVPENQKPVARKISRMSREAMLHLRDIVWSMNTERSSVADLYEKIREFASETLSVRDIQLDIQMKGFQEDMILPMELRQNLYLIAKEAIANIVKHSNGDAVNILFEKHERSGSLMIKDNGDVRAPSVSTGIGLNNMHERSKKIGGNLNINNDDGYEVNVEFSI